MIKIINNLLFQLDYAIEKKLTIVADMIQRAKFPESEQWEKENLWMETVTEAIDDYMISPRETRATLHVFGYLASNGVNIPDFLSDLVNTNPIKIQARYIREIHSFINDVIHGNVEIEGISTNRGVGPSLIESGHDEIVISYKKIKGCCDED